MTIYCTHLYRRWLLLLTLLLFTATLLRAQKVVQLDDRFNQHILSYNEIETFEDTSNMFHIQDVAATSFAHRFQTNNGFIPKNYHYKSTYWFRVRIANELQTRKSWIVEFYDQTIDNIHFYSPDKNGGYTVDVYGASYPFKERLFNHKNFTVKLDTGNKDAKVYYFSVRSQQPANIMVVLKPVSWFIQYGLKEYLLFGVFYGMIFVFCVYNFMMFLAVRQVQYIYYILYNISIGVFEMSSNGIAFQYLWPNAPAWNEIAFGIALYAATVFAMLFTRAFLQLKVRAPFLDKILVWLLVIRSVFFVFCLFNHQYFIYKFLDAVPLLVAFYAGCYVLHRGYYPARFFVAGYSFLLLGLIIRVLKTLASINLPFGPANFYSLNICFVMEMLFVSFAIGDRVRLMKKTTDLAQKRMIREMQVNQELKDNLNRELEKQVTDRTREVTEQADVIQQQNEDLLQANELLKQQAQEIARMNVMLAQDNQVLQVNIKKVNNARVLSAELDFPEFEKIYPDDLVCLQFLAELKNEKQFTCRKCDNHTWNPGHLPHSRRCTKCAYEESATTGTIFQNAHIPLNKAFYMVYMVYATKGKISSHKLSDMLSIRQSTCWTYTSKVKKLMEDRKKELRNAGEKGWSKLVIE